MSDSGPDLARVERQVDAFFAEGGQPGLAYGIVRHGRLVHAGGRGVAALPAGGEQQVPGPDTVFRIASMTKSFTASALLLLRDEGMLALDDEAARVRARAGQARAPTADAPPITVRMLLTMAAGFPTDDPWGDRQQGLPLEDFARLLEGGLSFAWSPGVAFEYSNLGYALLGRVVAAAAGQDYRDVVHERLLVPLGMASTCSRRPSRRPGASRPRARPHRAGLAGGAVRPVRRVRADGRAVQHGARPRPVGRGVHRCLPARATTPTAGTRCGAPRGASSSSRTAPSWRG